MSTDPRPEEKIGTGSMAYPKHIHMSSCPLSKGIITCLKKIEPGYVEWEKIMGVISQDIATSVPKSEKGGVESTVGQNSASRSLYP